MTYLDPARSAAHRPNPGLLAHLRGVARRTAARRAGDESGARLAFGAEAAAPSRNTFGPDLEHLARIALG